MIKINACCGKRDFGPDWIHIDGGDYPHLDYKDVTKLPFGNNTVDLIYCSHGIAYWDREEPVPILNEWKRALKPQGVLRLATPDFRVMTFLYHYIDNSLPLESFLGPVFGKMKMGDRTIYHKTTYDFVSLSELLREVGFRDVQKYNWRDTEHAKFDDHSSAHIPHDPEAIKERKFDSHTLISLNIEAIK